MQELMNFFLETSAWADSALLIDGILYFYLIKRRSDSRIRKKIIKEHKKPFDVSKVMMPPKVKINTDRFYINTGKDNEFNIKILYFFLKLQKYFNEEDLTLMYNNIQSIIISKNTMLKTFLSKLKEVEGTYYTKKNRIAVNLKSDDRTLYHELFHMATSFYSDGKYYSGFSQSNRPKKNIKNSFDLGNGLNEGYTEIMANRYFNTDISFSGYSYFIQIAMKLEEIVGKDKMENLYLHSNLKGLIEELSKYSSVDETIDFIKNLDFILYNEKIAEKDNIMKNYVKESIHRIAFYLSKICIEKIKQNYSKSEMKPEEVIQWFEYFAGVENQYFYRRIPGLRNETYIEHYNSLCNTLGILSKYDKELEIINITPTTTPTNLKSPI